MKKELENMHVIFTYHIEVRGDASENDLNRAAPIKINLLHADDLASLLTIHTDQSGFVGLIRHLHSRGFELLSMRREP
jgi:hypothetical protein